MSFPIPFKLSQAQNSIKGPFTAPTSSSTSTSTTTTTKITSIGPPRRTPDPLRVYVYGVREWKVTRLVNFSAGGAGARPGAGVEAKVSNSEKPTTPPKPKPNDRESAIIITSEEKIEPYWSQGKKLVLRFGTRGCDLTFYDPTSASSDGLDERGRLDERSRCRKVHGDGDGDEKEKEHEHEHEHEHQRKEAPPVRKEPGKVVGMSIESEEEELGRIIWRMGARDCIGAKVRRFVSFLILGSFLVVLVLVLPSPSSSLVVFLAFYSLLA